MNQQERLNLKVAIEDIAFRSNGLSSIMNSAAKAVNIRRVISSDEVRADIILYMDDVTERYNDQCYTLSKVMELVKKQGA